MSGAAAVEVERVPVSKAAEAYDVAPRTVKRWRAIGKEKGEPPPLGDPEGMLRWWTRNMSNRVPDGINAAVIAVRKANRAESLLGEMMPDPEPVAKVEAPALEIPVAVRREPVPIDAAPEGATGLEQALGRLGEIEYSLSKRALEPGQAKPWLDTISRMATLATQIRSEMEKAGALLPKTMVEQVIHEFHGPIEREVRMMYRTMCETLGLPATPNLEEAWNKECDRLFERLRTEVLR